MIFEQGGIQGEADKGKAEQAKADIPEAAIRDDAEQPEKRETFQRPSERDPFAIELDREDKGHEKESCRALPGKARMARGRIGLPLSNEEKYSGGVGHDEYGRREAIAEPRKRLGDDFVDECEM